MKLCALVLGAGLMVSSIAHAESLDEMYPAPWKASENSSITRALKEQGVEGCGKYRYRVAQKSNSEFLVYCYRGGSAKSAYMVWPNIHKVMGPYSPDDSLL